VKSWIPDQSSIQMAQSFPKVEYSRYRMASNLQTNSRNKMAAISTWFLVRFRPSQTDHLISGPEMEWFRIMNIRYLDVHFTSLKCFTGVKGAFLNDVINLERRWNLWHTRSREKQEDNFCRMEYQNLPKLALHRL
jgi:hypothetical protein